MAERRPTMMDPPIESLLERVDSKYTLVSLAAKRGREVNSYFNQLGDGLGSIVPPQVTSISRKPLSIALDEIRPGRSRTTASSNWTARKRLTRAAPKAEPRSPRTRGWRC